MVSPRCSLLSKVPVSIRARGEKGGVLISPPSQTNGFRNAIDQLYVKFDILSSLSTHQPFRALSIKSAIRSQL